MAVKPHTDREDAPSREDVRRRHRRRSRLLLMRRLAVVTLVIVLALVVWQHWDTLAPDKLIASIQDSMNNQSGGYPVDISGANMTAIAKADNYIVTLGDSYLTYYNSGGGEANRYPCTYSSALMRTAGQYVLLAEQNGTRVQLSNRSAIQIEMTTDNRIISAAVCAAGRFAVLTQSGQGYSVKVTVYDRAGEVVYSRSRQPLATAVALSPDGKEVALLSAQANNGVFVTSLDTFPLTGGQTEATYSCTQTDTLFYRLDYLNNDVLAAISEDGVLLADTRAEKPVFFDADNERVLSAVTTNGGVAVALRPYGATTGGRVAVLDTAATQLGTADFVGEFRNLSTDGNRYLLLTDSTAAIITAAGGGERATVEADGKAAVTDGNRAIVLGLNAISAYTLERAS